MMLERDLSFISFHLKNQKGCPNFIQPKNSVVFYYIVNILLVIKNKLLAVPFLQGGRK